MAGDLSVLSTFISSIETSPCRVQIHYICNSWIFIQPRPVPRMLAKSRRIRKPADTPPAEKLGCEVATRHSVTSFAAKEC